MLTPLEHRVIAMLLDYSGPAAALFRRQAAHLEVTSRNATGVGFFTHFKSNATDRLPETVNCHLGDLIGKTSAAPNGVSFVLFVRQGQISFLEGSAFDDPWPQDEDAIALCYWDDRPRDAQVFRKLDGMIQTQ